MVSRVLVVDDDKGVLDTVSMLVRALGYDCDGFFDPEEALDGFSRDKYQLAIIDLNLGSWGFGNDLGYRLRKVDDDISMVLATGSIPADLTDKSYLMFDSQLSKPFSLPELKSTLEKLIGEK